MFRYLFDLFFPKACLGCKRVLVQNEQIICTTCRHNLPLTQTHRTANNQISQKFYGRVPIEHVSSLFYFNKNHFTQELIHNLKYRGFQEIGTLFGYWYGEELKDIVALKTVDYVIPIPLHKKRLRERGYNQVETFGKALAKTLNKPYNKELLIRELYTKTQSQKNRNDRQEQLDQLFNVTDINLFANKHFLLVDDVLTTGATIEAAVKKLLQIPNCKVSVVTLAYAEL